jgi:hypothetical protein
MTCEQFRLLGTGKPPMIQHENYLMQNTIGKTILFVYDQDLRLVKISCHRLCIRHVTFAGVEASR